MLELNDVYGVSSNPDSSSKTKNMNNNNRWWPVRPPARFNSQYRQHRTRNTRRNPFYQSQNHNRRYSTMTSKNKNKMITLYEL